MKWLRRLVRELHYQTIGRKHVHAWHLASRITSLMPAWLRQAVIVDAGCRATQSSVIGGSNYAGPDGLEFSHLYEAATVPYGGRLGDGPEHHALRERTKRLEAWMVDRDSESEGDMLTRLGTDAAEWAREFVHWNPTAGLSDKEGDTLCGWFANAIEAGRSAGFGDGQGGSLVEVLARDLFDNRLGWSGGNAPHAPTAFWMALGMALGVNPQWALTEFASEDEAMATMAAAESLYAQAVGSTS